MISGGFFTRYTALIANLFLAIEIKSNVILNLEHIFSFKNGYICTKQADKSYYNRGQ